VVRLQGVSFDVQEHEIRAIIGPNGAGKSSMLNVINAYTHRSKERCFKGRKRRNVSSRGGAAGYRPDLPEHRAVSRMTVLDNIMTDAT